MHMVSGGLEPEWFQQGGIGDPLPRRNGVGNLGFPWSIVERTASSVRSASGASFRRRRLQTGCKLAGDENF